VPHPLGTIEPRLLRLLTIRLGVLLVFATALMVLVDVPLQGESSPWGIVSFQLAGTPYRALGILLEWKSRNAIGHAKLSLLVDFVYLVIYGLFFASLALGAGARLGDKTWSSRAAWAATYASALDALENAVLLYEVSRFTSSSPFPQLAASFAAAKFALLLFCASYGAAGGIAALWRRQRRPL
jgi:hypothetical protein